MCRPVSSRIPVAAEWVLLSALLVCVPRGSGRARQDPNKTTPPEQTKHSPQPAGPNDYVGTEVCKTCRENMPAKGCRLKRSMQHHLV